MLCGSHKIHRAIISKYAHTFYNPFFTPINIFINTIPFILIIAKVFIDVVWRVGKNQINAIASHMF